MSKGRTVVRLATLVILIASLAIASLVITNWTRSNRAVSARLIQQQADLAADRFELFFKPVVSALHLMRIRALHGILLPDDVENVRLILAPLVDPLTQVTSAAIASRDRVRVELERKRGWGARPKMAPIALPNWIRGTLDLLPAQDVFWSDLGDVEDDDEPAVAAAIGWKTNQGAEFALALAIPHGAVQRFVAGLARRV